MLCLILDIKYKIFKCVFTSCKKLLVLLSTKSPLICQSLPVSSNFKETKVGTKTPSASSVEITWIDDDVRDEN